MDVPSSSQIAPEVCNASTTNGNQLAESAQEKEGKPSLYITPRHQMGQTLSATMNVGHGSQDQQKVEKYIHQTSQDLQASEDNQSAKPLPKSRDEEVQIEVSKSLPLTGVLSAHVFAQAHGPESVWSPGGGILEHARNEGQKRLKEIELGKRKTIFTASGYQHEHIGDVTSSRLPRQATSVHEAEFEPYTGPEPSTDKPHRKTQTPASAVTSALSTDSPSEVLASSSRVPRQRSVPSGMLKQRFVPLGMDPGIAGVDSVSTSDPSVHHFQAPGSGEESAMIDENFPHYSIKRTSPHALEDQEVRGGFFVDFAHRAEEMIENIGDVARRRVPESVGDYLR